MVSRADQKQQDKNTTTSTHGPVSDFNFDLWATAVKRQMIASLRRRGTQV